MPIYEYVCGECGGELEKLQRLSDAPLVSCPACGEDGLKRKISAAGFRLAGGGWYETDFKSDGKRNLAGDNASSEKKSAGADKAADKGSNKGKSDSGSGKSSSSAGKNSESRASSTA